MPQIIFKKTRAMGSKILGCALENKTVMVGGDPVSMYLQMGMKKRSSRGRKMVLGNSHINCLRQGLSGSRSCLAANHS
jgi:hypothetical protein